MAIAIPQLKFPQIKGPAWLQFGLFFGFSLLLSLLLFALFARPLVWRTRGEYSLFLASVAQSLRGGPAAFEEIIPSMNRFGVESWILDLQGRTLASSHHRPLPLDWDLLEKPDEAGKLTMRGTVQGAFDSLYVVRMEGRVPQYLVTYFSRRTTGFRIGFLYVFLLTLWIYVIAVVAAFLLLDLKKRQPEFNHPKNSQSGFGLVEALIALMIAAISMAAMQTLLTLGFKGNAHTDLRANVRALSDTLKGSVDCVKTFATVTPSVDCVSATLKPLLLKDSNDKQITENLIASSATFDPKDNTTNGAGKLGEWMVRAYCQGGTDAVLFIRYSRWNPQGNAFFSDPLTHRAYDWQDSPSNPLFGSTDRLLCKGMNSTTVKPYGFLGSRSVYRQLAALGNVQLNGIPPTTRVVKMSMNAANFSSTSDPLSEDGAFLQATANLVSSTSTGYYGVIGGTGPANVALFRWQDESFAGLINVDGWTTPTDPSVLAASLFRPRFSYDPTTNTFKMEDLPNYVPALYAFLFDFFGE